MSVRFVLRQRALPAYAGAILAGAGTLLMPRNIYAEAPQSTHTRISSPRKPIYDDPVRPHPQAARNSSNEPQETQPTPNLPLDESASVVPPTATDRLAVQVRHARLFLHDLSNSAETSFNNFMTRAFNLEDNFTNTVRSLAPPPEANEPILPGLAYIFVAALAGTIISRRRGIILRTVTPLTGGIVAAYAVLPTVMSNVETLMQDWDGRYSPELRERHIRARERVKTFVETGIEHSKMSLQMGEDKLGEARKSVEEWVSKGR